MSTHSDVGLHCGTPLSGSTYQDLGLQRPPSHSPFRWCGYEIDFLRAVVFISKCIRKVQIGSTIFPLSSYSFILLMLSQETVSYDDEDTDPRLVAFARRPFQWRVGETVQIPIGLAAAFLDGERGMDSFHHMTRTSEFESRLRGFMSWFCAPFPHPHVHVDLLFVHRPLARKVITYNEAERESLAATDVSI